jgi:folate-binding protein YgfZ
MSEGYRALRNSAAWLNLSARGRIRVTGRDRARLLHNVTSNEVRKLAPGSGCYAFLLTPQGRIQADLNLLCFSDHFLIDAEAELREKVPRLILKYKVADQVELEDVTESTFAIGLEGPGAKDALAAAGAPIPGEPYAHLAWGDWTVANLSVSGAQGFRVFGMGRAPAIFAGSGVPAASDAEVRQVRIENGRPRFGEDIRETNLPQETGQMHAVSFTKGCYIGQEIVERIRAQGHVNKTLVRLALERSDAPQAGTKLTVDGKEAGEITSAVYSVELGRVAALGYVRVAHAEAGTALDAGGVQAKVV